MEQQIKELIDFQKIAKEEAQHILDTIKYLTEEDVIELETEVCVRNGFISDLENLLAPENKIEVNFDENQDKF